MLVPLLYVAGDDGGVEPQLACQLFKGIGLFDAPFCNAPFCSFFPIMFDHGFGYAIDVRHGGNDEVPAALLVECGCILFVMAVEDAECLGAGA